MIKNLFLDIFLCSLLVFSCCSNINEDTSSITSEYNDYKTGCKSLSTDTKNDLSSNDSFYVELPESTTAYKWVYTKTNSNIALQSEKSFNLNDSNPAWGQFNISGNLKLFHQEMLY
jgi:hypothetical protein